MVSRRQAPRLERAAGAKAVLYTRAGGGATARPRANGGSVSPARPERYEIRRHVEPGDIDELGHVNNIVYLRWVQDAAVAHWRALATPEQQAALVWVVVRHEIDYRHPALEREELIVRTWVGTASRSTFERHTEVVRASDARLLARARTLWFPLDARTLKPAAVGPDVRARFSVPEV
jgi:acyl-CoA thioester hydrolase